MTAQIVQNGVRNPAAGASRYTTADIRNVLIAGHALSGKTSLVDALLFASGTVTRKASPIDGSSFSDFEKDEKEFKHSIYSKLLHMDHLGKRINLIDAPGAPDLLGQALLCLPAVETVAIVISATNGIEVSSRRMFDAAKQRNLPRAIIVNKIDAPGVDLIGLVASIQETFGADCIPINLPVSKGQAVTECLLSRNGESDFGSITPFHTALLDHVADMDDQLMEQYLAGEEPNYEALHAPFEKAMDTGHIVPILFTSARTGAGLSELLDAMARHFPSPQEGNLRPFETEGGHAFEYSEDPAGKLLAHVFKITVDPFVGKMAVIRVHQGTLRSQSQVLIGHSKKPVKLGHLFQIQGKDHAQVTEVIAGDLGAIAKIEELHPGDVLHDDHALDAVHFAREPMPQPLFGLAIMPKNRADEAKLTQQLARLAEEDPTFQYHVDPATHELVVSGLGELHLKLILHKLEARHIAVDAKPPRIAYKETIQIPADGHHRHKKQTGGAGQFGEVFLKIEPAERGEGFLFHDEIFGGAIPGQYVPAIEKGCRDLLPMGPLTGNPIVDVKVTVLDGKHHAVDSKEIAFRTAGKFAFKDAFMKARPVLLEPIVKMEITTPQHALGHLTGDLAAKRGRIISTETLPGNLAQIIATAPLAEMMQYTSQLKSATAGQGSFSMELSHYDPAPPQIAKDVIASYRPAVEVE